LTATTFDYRVHVCLRIVVPRGKTGPDRFLHTD
jgi:hypothetical protein